MKGLLRYVTILGLSIFSLANASELSGVGKNYELMDTEPVQQITTQKNIVPQITLDSISVHFEKENIKNISRLLGGAIAVNSETTWVCFNSHKENRTYWFLSDNEMQHGDLSGVAVSLLDEKAGCSDTNKVIGVSLNGVGIGSMLNELNSIYQLGNNQKITDVVSLETDKDCGNEYNQLNTTSYYLKGGMVYGVLYTQVTSN